MTRCRLSVATIVALCAVVSWPTATAIEVISTQSPSDDRDAHANDGGFAVYQKAFEQDARRGGTASPTPRASSRDDMDGAGAQRGARGSTARMKTNVYTPRAGDIVCPVAQGLSAVGGQGTPAACHTVSADASQQTEFSDSPAVPTIADFTAVTATGFGELTITPPSTTLGPGWDYIPVNYTNAVWTDGSDQMLDTTILGTPVTIRARPVEYRWDFGDGRVIVSTFPGASYPEHEIYSAYRHQGWYLMSLQVIYEGAYSVDGGPFVPIDGTVTVDAASKWIYARSMTTRVVGDNEQSREEYKVPARSAETLGPQRERPKTTRITKPMKREKPPHRD